MPDQIEPALTPSEWARVPEHAAHDGLQNAIAIAVRARRFPSVIALSNSTLPDNDPRKITPDRIKAMRDCAEQLGLMGYDDYGLQRFADALASYLPPNDTAGQ